MVLSVGDILNVTGGKLLSGSEECVFLSLTIDSREIGERSLFVPIKGESSDGHDYIEKALQGGAIGTLTEEPEAFEYYEDNHEDMDKVFILVEDTVDALQRIGRACGDTIAMRAVGVTGSVGKTTTREMIFRALAPSFRTFVTGKNYNNRLGVPITLSSIPRDTETAVLELGMNTPGELGLISSLTNLDCAVITNIGDAHMEYYGSRETIAREKLTITNGFRSGDPSSKVLFLNGDDPVLRALMEEIRPTVPYEIVTFGLHGDTTYSGLCVTCENGCYLFDFAKNGKPLVSVRLSALGEHNILNAVAALAVADFFGADLKKAAESLAEFTGFKGRLERKEQNGVLFIDDTYNASPVSMKAGLKVLSEISYGSGDGRKIAVLGDMLELGDTSDDLHGSVGEYAASLPITDFFLVGEKAKKIGDALRKNGTHARLHEETTRDEVTETLRETLRPGDIVYLKASRRTELNKITEALLTNG